MKFDSQPSTSNSNDQKALLTSAPETVTTDAKKHQKIAIALISILICAVALTVVLLFAFGVFDDESSESNAGMIGLWPTWGGTLQNQQKPPYPSDVTITTNNVNNLKIQCLYQSPNGIGTMGYPAIDSDLNAYFTDISGYVTSINLDSCQVIWRSHIGTLLGYDMNMTILTTQSITLFQDSNAQKGALFAAPQQRTSPSNPYNFSTYPDNAGCYAIAVHLNNGTLWWRVAIGQDNNAYNYKCSSSGFFVDGKYAYGGMAQSADYDANFGSQFIGRYLKIDIDSHEIVNEWYPYNKNLTEWDEFNMSYLGVAAYHFPAILDDFLVFGTGNFYRSPKYIDDCLTYGQGTNISSDGYNQYLELDKSQYIDICGNDQSNNRFWRCLEKDMFSDSLIILNKTNFNVMNTFPLQGCDIYYHRQCKLTENYSAFCPGEGNEGTNSDLTAIATFKNKSNGRSYVVASQKSTRLHVFELETGKLIMSRKFGPGSLAGQFNMAVDEDAMIGITSFHGDQMFGILPRYKLANNVTVCEGTGSIHAFDMNTGNTLYQIINPYGTIDESECFNDSNYEYIDYTVNTSCEYGDFLEASMTASDKVIIPPISNNTFIPISAKARAKFKAPVTIVNNMVFIPSSTGDIWVHHLLNGTFIHHFTCPNVLMNEEMNQWNRAGIKGGISIVNDRAIFYCGLYWGLGVEAGNTLVSMKLESETS